MVGVHRARNIRYRISRRLDIWDRGLHTGLVVDGEVERATREGRAASAVKD